MEVACTDSIPRCARGGILGSATFPFPSFLRSLCFSQQITEDGQNMADEVNTAHCPLDKLFTRNVPHILENIFFSLDYESFKMCMEVNKEWYELLTSRLYKKKALVVFREGISKDETKLWSALEIGNAGLVTRLVSNGLVNVDCVREICGGWDETTVFILDLF